MWYYITKVVVSAVLIVAISEIAKRSSLLGAILASIPLISVIAIIWLYHETGDTAKISTLASSVFWLVIPSLALFVTLPSLLKIGVGFYWSLGVSIMVTIGCYFLMIQLLSFFEIKL